MPCDYSRYPPNWFTELRPAILKRAEIMGVPCCEGSPAYPDCRAENYSLHPVTWSKVVLTIAHLDHDIENNDLGNLQAMCQRCHLTHDAKQHAQNAYETRRRGAVISDLFAEEHDRG